MKKLSRREMLRIMGISAAGVGLAACGAATPTAAPQATTAPEATTAATEPAAAEATATTAEAAPTTAPAQGAPVKITMVESWFGIPQYIDSINPVTQAITQKMQSEGVNIEIQSMILDDWNNKYPLLYSSGADFTMAFDAPWVKMTSLRDQGALAPIENLVEEFGQNLKKETTEKIYNANFMNGHLYGIPACYYYRGTTGVIMREDLRKKYNAAEPDSGTGISSLRPFLEAIHTNLPDFIPFVDAATWSITSLYSTNTWLGQPGLVIADWTKGYEVVDLESVPEYIAAAKELRAWWSDGLVNKTDLPQSATSQNFEVDYIYPNKAGSCIENEPDYKYVDMDRQMKASLSDAELKGYDLTGQRAGKKGTGSLVAGNFIVFNANAPKEQQQAGIQYFDWLTTSQDNMDLWLMGIDGTNYKKEDNLTFSEISGTDATRNYRRQWYVSGLSGKYQRQPNDLPQYAKDSLAFFSTESNFNFNPYETFTVDTKAIEAELAQLNAVLLEAYHGLDTGQMDTDEAIAKAKSMMDGAGRQAVKAKLQKQLDDYIAAHPAK
jgi:putative aldouronate transport system substrate-binding protein